LSISSVFNGLLAAEGNPKRGCQNERVADPWRPDPHLGVFETLLMVDGHPVEWEAHIARLEASLGALFPTEDRPSLPPLDVPVESGPYGHLPTGTSARDGLSALRITVALVIGVGLQARVEARATERRTHPVALLGLTVPGGLGPHKWADRSLLDAVQAELPEGALPLIVDLDGAVLEASRANVFVVRDGVLLTPPLDGRILPGITRMRVLELATAAGIDSRERALTRTDLLAAEEVFLTGSVRGVERVRSLDGTTLASGGEVASGLGTELLRTWTAAKVG
jgi:para-aminobenzoate synthetase/4-amino-4-deoxychorismate lyase